MPQLPDNQIQDGPKRTFYHGLQKYKIRHCHDFPIRRCPGFPSYQALTALIFRRFLEYGLYSKNLPGRPAAHNQGPLSMDSVLLHGIVACYFGLLGFPGTKCRCFGLTRLAKEHDAHRGQEGAEADRLVQHSVGLHSPSAPRSI